MRIAIATRVGRLVGGVESYLARLIPALVHAGNDVGVWYDDEGPLERQHVDVRLAAPRWSVEELGPDRAARSLSEWAPDVLFSHGVATAERESALMRVAPAVLFAHAYYGACISGWKSRLSPMRAPCSRPLGWPCLLHYLPRRCGGLNPSTMVSLYRIETRRKALLPRYRAIITASRHMQMEYERYVGPNGGVHAVDLPIEHAEDEPAPRSGGEPSIGMSEASGANLQREWRILFIGRVTELKGLHLAIDALPYLRQQYEGRIALTVLGDGDERASAQRQATRVCARLADVTVRFLGWQGDAERTRQLRTADLLVVPSVWPEPFGMVGPEAGLLGVPAAAFAVGGVSAWLEDGVNGHLADGEQPRARSLASAMVRCLDDPAHHATLRAGAARAARRFTMARHLAQVMPILERAAGS